MTISHPGEILQTEFLDEMEITQYALHKATGLPKSRISEICKGTRSITADTAVILSRFFGNSAEFWLNLQQHYDLVKAQGSFKVPKGFKTAKEVVIA